MVFYSIRKKMVFALKKIVMNVGFTIIGSSMHSFSATNIFLTIFPKKHLTVVPQ